MGLLMYLLSIYVFGGLATCLLALYGAFRIDHAYVKDGISRWRLLGGYVRDIPVVFLLWPAYLKTWVNS